MTDKCVGGYMDCGIRLTAKAIEEEIDEWQWYIKVESGAEYFSRRVFDRKDLAIDALEKQLLIFG